MITEQGNCEAWLLVLSFSVLALSIPLSLFLRMRCSLEENEFQLILHLNAAEHSAHSSNTSECSWDTQGACVQMWLCWGLSVCVGPKERESWVFGSKERETVWDIIQDFQRGQWVMVSWIKTQTSYQIRRTLTHRLSTVISYSLLF